MEINVCPYCKEEMEFGGVTIKKDKIEWFKDDLPTIEEVYTHYKKPLLETDILGYNCKKCRKIILHYYNI